MSNAMSHRSAVMIGKESAFGTAVAATVAVPATQESFSVDEGFEFDGAMRNDPADLVAAPGLRKIKGGLQVSPNGAEIGRLLEAAFGTVNTDPLTQSVTNAPTAAPAPGGNLPVGDAYRYKVAAVVRHEDSGLYMCTNPSPSSVQATTDAPNRAVNVGWTPVVADPGYALVGYHVFRTENLGAPGSERFLAFVPGAGTNFLDDGSAVLALAITAPSSAYRHRFTRSASGELPSFTAEIRKDNGSSERYSGLKAGSLKMSAQPDQKVGFDLDFLAKNVEPITSTVPSFAMVAPFMGHRVLVYVQDEGENDTLFSLATKFDLTVENGLAERWNLNGTRTVRALKAGRQQVSGSLEADLETMDIFRQFLANTPSACRLLVWGPPVAPALTQNVTVEAQEVTVTSWRYALEVHIPALYLLSHQANSQGENPIVQQLSWRGRKNAAAGYQVQVALTNLTVSYA